MNGFFDFFWLMLWFFMWIIWLLLLFRVFGDVFRSQMSGVAKAAWILFVIVAPFLGVFAYLIVNGDDMAQREAATARSVDEAQRGYIRSVVESSGGVADELEKLAALRDRGVLDESEFAAQKARLLG